LFVPELEEPVEPPELVCVPLDPPFDDAVPELPPLELPAPEEPAAPSSPLPPEPDELGLFCTPPLLLLELEQAIESATMARENIARERTGQPPDFFIVSDERRAT
jgi:hypothetical protein